MCSVPLRREGSRFVEMDDGTGPEQDRDSCFPGGSRLLTSLPIVLSDLGSVARKEELHQNS